MASEGSSMLSEPLKENDPVIYDLICEEKERQIKGIELIASENFTSTAVLQCLGSCLTNKYSEGEVDRRYYSGNKYIDQIEQLCKSRALAVFRLDEEKWGVNVQPYSGSPANFAVYTGLLNPHDRIMGLDLPDGGHLTHGFMTEKRRVSATSVYFESMPYKVDPKSGLVDYDQLEQTAKLFRPKIIIAGSSAYSREFDYARFRSICDSIGAILLADMAHISGLVAGNALQSPFDFADVVTTTTHKSLRGPRAGMIFFRKGLKNITSKGDKIMYNYESAINQAVFPALQGGPHNNNIAGIAVALKQADTEEFRSYARQVIKNAQALSSILTKKGYSIVTGGTDMHMFLLDVRPQKLSGSKADAVLEKCQITANKNTVPGDKSALNPGGMRIGTPAITSRNMKEAEMEKLADFIDEALKIAIEIEMSLRCDEKASSLKEFKAKLSQPDAGAKIEKLSNTVEEFAAKYPMPGF